MRHFVRPAAIVAAHLDTLNPVQQAMVRDLQQAVQGAVPSLEQMVKWGNLTFTSHGRNVVAVVVHKAHANLQVFNGALLCEQIPELEGVGKGMRQVKLRYGQPIDGDLIGRIVRAAAALADAGGAG